MEVVPLAQFQELEQRFQRLDQRMTDLEQQLPAWVGQKEAEKLTGYSRTWLFRQRKAGKLPIKYKKTGARTIIYDRADCVAFGRKHLIHPPTFPTL